jgi:hypothetical protein
MESYRIEIVVDRLKVEHVGEALRRLQRAAESLALEGLDVGITQSVEKDRDGVERWPEWVAADGTIRDVQPWQGSAPSAGEDLRTSDDEAYAPGDPKRSDFLSLADDLADRMSE